MRLWLLWLVFVVRVLARFAGGIARLFSRAIARILRHVIAQELELATAAEAKRVKRELVRTIILFAGDEKRPHAVGLR